MARISSGSSDGASGAERGGAVSRLAPSELKGSDCSTFGTDRRARRALELGVIDRDEWISPRRFLGVGV